MASVSMWQSPITPSLLLGLLSGFIRIRPPAIFSDEVFIDGWNPFFGPQLTLPLAVLIAWLATVCLPNALTAAFSSCPN